MSELLAISLVLVTALALRVVVGAVMQRLAILPKATEDLSGGLRDVVTRLRGDDFRNTSSGPLTSSSVASPQTENPTSKSEQAENPDPCSKEA